MRLSQINFDKEASDVTVCDVLHELKFWGTGPLGVILEKATEELSEKDGNHEAAFVLLDEVNDGLAELGEALQRVHDQWDQKRLVPLREDQGPETKTEPSEALPAGTAEKLCDLISLFEHGIQAIEGIMAPKGGEGE